MENKDNSACNSSEYIARVAWAAQMKEMYRVVT